MSYSYPAPAHRSVMQRMSTDQQKQREMLEARLKQQQQQNEKSNEFAIKQKQKEEEKRQLKIEKWEKMQGWGKGQFLGGTEVCTGLTHAREQSIAIARERMQHDNNTRVANWVPSTEPSEQDIAEQKRKEREAAKSLKKIADWERMYGLSGGQQLGAGGSSSQFSSSHHKPLQSRGPQAEKPASATTMDPEEGLELSEEKKRQEMRTARLRMQQAQDRMLAKQSSANTNQK